MSQTSFSPSLPLSPPPPSSTTSTLPPHSLYIFPLILCCSIEMYVRLSLLHMPWAANFVDKWERNKWGENPLLLHQHKNRNKFFVTVAFIDKEWSNHVRKPLAERETWEVLPRHKERREVLPLAERETWGFTPGRKRDMRGFTPGRKRNVRFYPWQKERREVLPLAERETWSFTPGRKRDVRFYPWQKERREVLPLAERETWEVLPLAEREAGEVLPLAQRETWETIPCPLSMSKTPWSRAFFRRSSTMTGMTMMMMTATATHRPTYSGMLSSSSARLAAENKQPSLYRDLTQPSSYRDLTQTISLPWINTTGCWTQAAISLRFLTVI